MSQLRFTAQYRATQCAYYQKESEWDLNLRLTFVSLFVKQLNLTQINKFSCFSKIIPKFLVKLKTFSYLYQRLDMSLTRG